MTRKFVPIILSIVAVAVGVPLVILGYERTFNFVSCPVGAITCIRVSVWSDLAILIGSVAVLSGVTILILRAVDHVSAR